MVDISRSLAGRATPRSVLALLAVVSLLFTMMSLMGPALATHSDSPTLATATVDGNPSEWTGEHKFADLVSGSGTATADAYLRYDCTTQTLFVYVDAHDGQVLFGLISAGDHLAIMGVDVHE
ncbi:MAG TPA: hypothetical protein VHG52_10995 [Thermomicrobiales bacterium]|nr:hypothetical protein [Thermomicrobiales bacterium]